MTRLDCLASYLVVSLLASSVALAQDKPSNRQTPQKIAPKSSAPVDDSDLPKPFQAPPPASKKEVPAFLGLFGPVGLIEKSGFNSAPGKWIEYQVVSSVDAGAPSDNTLRIQEVGPTPRGSRWIEMHVTASEVGSAGIRILVKGEGDGNVERVIAKAPQMPPIEFPVSSADLSELSLGPSSTEGGQKTRSGYLRLVGQEKVKVPLGTFMCDHWVLDTGRRQYDYWLATDRSIPFIRAVKFTTAEGIAVAAKVGTDAVGTILVPGPRRPNE